MTKPTIHTNGTSADDLRDGYLKALAAIRNAVKAVQETYPNGRDYYPQGPCVIYRAMEEHEGRLSALQHVHDELGELLESLDW